MENLEHARKTNLLIGLIVLASCGGKDIVPQKTIIRDSLENVSSVVLKDSITHQGIITSLITKEKIIALTFDACETITPSYFDTSIMNYLVRDSIPFTVFMGGKFAVRNRNQLRILSQLPFVEIENHSYNHVEHMEKLTVDSLDQEVHRNEDTIVVITGRRTKFFRFPGGNYDLTALQTIENMGYVVVHWSFESGDPDKKVTQKKLEDWVLSKAKPGNILIFHINGRGYATGKALPKIVTELRRQGYYFVTLDQGLKSSGIVK